MGRGDLPTAVAAKGRADNPRRLESMVPASAAAVVLVTAAVNVVFAISHAVTAAVNIFTTVVDADAVAVTVATAANAVPVDVTGAASAFTAFRPGAELTYFRTGGRRYATGADQRRERTQSRRAYGVWTAVADGRVGGYRSCALASSSTAQEPPSAHHLANKLSTSNSYAEGCADEYSEL